MVIVATVHKQVPCVSLQQRWETRETTNIDTLAEGNLEDAKHIPLPTQPVKVEGSRIINVEKITTVYY